ncbi:hypothetical protein RB594_008295 [Gaeumannomyces avenae]
MDPSPQTAPSSAGQSPPAATGHRRSATGTSSFLSKLQAPFLRSSSTATSHPPLDHSSPDEGALADAAAAAAAAAAASSSRPYSSIAIALQQQKTRRRRGSLRKVALLGRRAQHERSESAGALEFEPQHDDRALPPVSTTRKDGSSKAAPLPSSSSSPSLSSSSSSLPSLTLSTSGAQEADVDLDGTGISDDTPRPSTDGATIRIPTSPGIEEAGPSDSVPAPQSLRHSDVPPNTKIIDGDITTSSPTMMSYSTTTTDDEDGLHMARRRASTVSPLLLRPDRLSSGSESYFPSGGLLSPTARVPLQRRRSEHRAKSPLSLASLSPAMPARGVSQEHHRHHRHHHQHHPAEWDYSETEWWGWVVLFVTWFVFVTGMGSCLGVWSWAWDVGTTPYAPPELEDDPTLPIVGYYPALIILTCIMAWVWVVVAWMGMKYFRHAKISGD